MASISFKCWSESHDSSVSGDVPGTISRSGIAKRSAKILCRRTSDGLIRTLLYQSSIVPTGDSQYAADPGAVPTENRHHVPPIFASGVRDKILWPVNSFS